MTNWHSYLDETKRGLAKLLARENITVRHATVDTAMFNIQTRELLLPKWKDITVDQYDLLIGHEVGHALYTDRDRLDLLEASQPYHSYVNVIEDTRIERRIKDAFPGLTGAFTRGYADFFKNGPIFNDVHQRPMDSYTFIDRINIHYKIGAHVRVPFAADELPWLKRIDALRTFEEAVKLAKELFDREKAKPSAKPSETEASKGRAKGTSSSPSSNGTGSGDEAGEQPENAPNGDTPSDAKDGSKAQHAAADPSSNASTPNGDPVAETDLSNASALKSMASSDDNDPIMLTYATVSPAQMAAQIVTTDQVLTKWQSAYRADQRQPAATIREKFNTQYGPVIAHMAREFERRKTAKLMERARVSRSGRLDTTKLASYKFREDLFKQVMSLPQGKSHGIVVLIDGSGSMSPVFSDTLEQALVLGQFAKKVNVPFKALMFTSHYAYGGVATPFGYKPETLMPDRSCRLVTLLDTAAPNWAMQEEIVCAAANAYTARSYERTCPAPPYFSLGQTPLYSGMLMVEPILDQMKSQYRLDKTTLFILTDGEDSNSVAYVDATGQENARLNRFAVGAKSRALIVRDARTRKTYGRVVETTQYDYHSGKDVPAVLNTMNVIPEMLVEMIRDRHQTRVMLIRLLDRRSLRRMKSATSEVADTLTSLLRVPFASNENFVRRSEILTAAQLTAIATALTGKDSTGQTLVPASATYYDAVLLVNPSTLDLDEDDFDDLVKDGMSAKRIAAAFTKSNVTAARNKVFVNAVIPHLI